MKRFLHTPHSLQSDTSSGFLIFGPQLLDRRQDRITEKDTCMLDLGVVMWTRHRKRCHLMSLISCSLPHNYPGHSLNSSFDCNHFLWSEWEIISLCYAVYLMCPECSYYFWSSGVDRKALKVLYNMFESITLTVVLCHWSRSSISWFPIMEIQIITFLGKERQIKTG